MIAPSFDTADAAARLFAGNSGGWVAIAFWALAAFGAVAWARADRALAGIAVAAVAAQLLSVFLLPLPGAANPLILARYALVALPVLLVAVAIALRLALAPLARDDARVAGLLAASMVGVWVLAGPLLDPLVRSSSYLNSEDVLGFHAPRLRLVAGSRPPAPYELIRRDPRHGPVVEYTGAPTWIHFANLAIYQRHHRRRVLFAPEDEPALFSEGVFLRSFVAPRPGAFLASPALFLVVHRATARELDRIERPGGAGLVPIGNEMRRRARRLAERMENQLARDFGPPDASDDDVVVWDLDRVRQQRRIPT
jgi:hypothetical protein